MTASRIFLQERERFIIRYESFAFETTLAGHGYLKLVKRLKDAGWCVDLAYLALPGIQMCKLRVAERVAHGGHNIPERDIERHFQRSLCNLLTLFSTSVDHCSCFMNHGPVPLLVFEQEGDKRNITDDRYCQLLSREAGI